MVDFNYRKNTLYESDFDNRPKPQREAYLWHYNIFGKSLEEKINKFAKKYGLLVNRD